jgi:hypothetical protein
MKRCFSLRDKKLYQYFEGWLAGKLGYFSTIGPSGSVFEKQVI